MLVQSVEGDVTGWAWCALSELVSSDQGRKRALQLELPRRLPAALKSNFKVAYQALVVIDRLSVKASKAAAAVLAFTEVLADREAHGKYALALYDTGRYMRLDSAAQRALNVLRSRTDANDNFSLYGLLNRTRTAMGKRLLKARSR